MEQSKKRPDSKTPKDDHPIPFDDALRKILNSPPLPSVKAKNKKKKKKAAK